MAKSLGFKEADIEELDERTSKDACHEMFVQWLDRESDLAEVTWEALIQCLMNAGLMDIAEDLKECLVL